MPRDRNIRRALERQRDPALPPSLALDASRCPVLAPDVPMRIRLEKHEEPLPVCPEPDACPVRRFFAEAARDGAPVELDVGAGYGRFSRGHAAARPRIRLLAIEQEAARVARSDVAARLSGISNLALLRAEARWALEYCVPPESVSAVYVLFPDPWPKDRHARNRFFRAPNVALVRRLLRPGGVLQAATDNEPYFAQMLETMAAAPGFAPAEPAVRGENEKTDFERKFLSQGKRVFAAAWRKLATAAVLAALSAAAAFPGAARAAEWTGGGKSRSWNDAGNWADGSVPVPAPGLQLSFDAPEGASFGFKGQFRTGSIRVGTNSGPVSVRAAGTVLGGSVNSEPDVGWIVEDASATVRVENLSASALEFDGGLKAGWDVELHSATGAAVVVSGGLDAAGRKVSKTGAGAFELRGGKTVLDTFESRGGPTVLSDGADVAAPFSSLGSRSDPAGAGWTVGPGSRLALSSDSERIFLYSPLVLGGSPDDPPPAAGEPRARLEGAGRCLVFCVPPSFAPGCKVENAGYARFAFGGDSNAPAVVRMPAGMSWSGESIFLGGWPNDPDNSVQKNGLAWTKLSIEGAKIALKNDFSVGGPVDNVQARHMSAALSAGASLETGGAVRVPAQPGCSRGNSLRAGPGTSIACEGIFVGAGSVSNLIAVSGARVSVGKRGVDVGLEGNWDGPPEHNVFALGDKASLRAKSPLTVGRGRRGNGGKQLVARDNRVFVQGASRIETEGGAVGIGGTDEPTEGSRVDVSGPGSAWGLCGRDLVVGDARGGPVTNCAVVVRDGASLLGAQRVVVGAAGEGRASGCAIVVEGGRVQSTNEVRVGSTRDAKGKAPSQGNRIVLGGRKARGKTPARPGVWDFNKGALKIGCGTGWNQEIGDNRFELLPGGRAENVGPVQVGAGGEGAVSRGNRLCLLGGTISPVPSLSLGRRSVVEIAVDPSLKLGTSPLGIEGDADFGFEPAVLPVARPGAKPGTYPVLAWKGKTAGDLAALKLHPSADPKRWQLVVDAEGKRVGVKLLK